MGLKMPKQEKAQSGPEKDKDKKEKKAPVKADLATILTAIKKEKGEQTVVAGDKVPRVGRLRTGIFDFDFYTGGGFPKSRYTILYGPEQSWKTNLCYSAAAETQKLPGPCNKVVWVNLEQTFDPEFAAILGVDVSQLVVVQPLYGEEAVDLIDALVRAEDVALLVVDSVAALVPSKEIAQSVEKADVGTASLLIKRLVNKLMYAFAEESRKGHQPAVVLVNQTRFKIGVMFGDPETMPGGEAQKFLSSLRVRVYGKKKVVEAVHPNLHAFMEVHAVIKKAKVPVLAGSFNFSPCTYAHDGLEIGQTDSWGMVSGYLKQLGLLVKVSKGWEIEGMLFPTLKDAHDFYQGDHEFRTQCQQLVIEAHKGKGMLIEEQQSNPSASQQPGQVVETGVVVQ